MIKRILSPQSIETDNLNFWIKSYICKTTNGNCFFDNDNITNKLIDRSNNQNNFNAGINSQIVTLPQFYDKNDIIKLNKPIHIYSRDHLVETYEYLDLINDFTIGFFFKVKNGFSQFNTECPIIDKMENLNTITFRLTLQINTVNSTTYDLSFLLYVNNENLGTLIYFPNLIINTLYYVSIEKKEGQYLYGHLFEKTEYHCKHIFSTEISTDTTLGSSSINNSITLFNYLIPNNFNSNKLTDGNFLISDIRIWNKILDFTTINFYAGYDSNTGKHSELDNTEDPSLVAYYKLNSSNWEYFDNIFCDLRTRILDYSSYRRHLYNTLDIVTNPINEYFYIDENFGVNNKYSMIYFNTYINGNNRIPKLISEYSISTNFFTAFFVFQVREFSKFNFYLPIFGFLRRSINEDDDNNNGFNLFLKLDNSDFLLDIGFVTNLPKENDYDRWAPNGIAIGVENTDIPIGIYEKICLVFVCKNYTEIYHKTSNIYDNFEFYINGNKIDNSSFLPINSNIINPSSSLDRNFVIGHPTDADSYNSNHYEFNFLFNEAILYTSILSLDKILAISSYLANEYSIPHKNFIDDYKLYDNTNTIIPRFTTSDNLKFIRQLISFNLLNINDPLNYDNTILKNLILNNIINFINNDITLNITTNTTITDIKDNFNFSYEINKFNDIITIIITLLNKQYNFTYDGKFISEEFII